MKKSRIKKYSSWKNHEFRNVVLIISGSVPTLNNKNI